MNHNLKFLGCRKTLVWLSLLLPMFGLAYADIPQCSVAFLAPSEPIKTGNPASLWLYAFNDTSLPIEENLPLKLEASYHCGSHTFRTVLTLKTNDSMAAVTVRPGDEVKSEYQCFLKSDVAGIVTLDISNYNPVTLLILPSPTLARGSDSGPVSSPSSGLNFGVQTNTGGSGQMADYVRRHVVSHISYYEPIYFILGNPIAEFQLSLKYQVFNFQQPDTLWTGVANHAYFAYTQTSYWDLLTSDPYFYDNSYKPSMFLYYTNVISRRDWQLDWQGGTEHESNGKGGSGERSLFTAYVQPTLTLDLPADFSLSFQPRARLYYWVGQNNPDIAQYRGNADLLTALTWQRPGSGERIQFAAKYQVGDEGAHAGWLFDLRFNLAGLPVLDHFNPTIQLQYFTGYGQTLLLYNQSSSAFRAGLCLWY